MADFSKEYYDAKREENEIKQTIAKKETRIYELNQQLSRLRSSGYSYTTIEGTPGDNYVKEHEVKAGYKDSAKAEVINSEIRRLQQEIRDLRKKLESIQSKKNTESRNFVNANGSYESILRRRRYQSAFQKFVSKISGKNRKFLKIEAEYKKYMEEVEKNHKKGKYDFEGEDRKKQRFLEQMSELYPDKRKGR